MGFEIKEHKSNKHKENEAQKKLKRKDCVKKVLVQLNYDIEQLQAQDDLKKLLKKCISGILLSNQMDSEILVLTEIRGLLKKVKQTNDLYYIQLFSIISDIYMLAVDKQLQNQIDQSVPSREQRLQEVQRDIQEFLGFTDHNDPENNSESDSEDGDYDDEVDTDYMQQYHNHRAAQQQHQQAQFHQPGHRSQDLRVGVSPSRFSYGAPLQEDKDSDGEGEGETSKINLNQQ